MYERLGADIGPLNRGPGVEAADQPRTSGTQANNDPGVTAAGRVRLVADGGGLENRYGARVLVGSNPTPSAQPANPAPDHAERLPCGADRGPRADGMAGAAWYLWPVVPVSFHDFFSGCATVAGALIGLLFVALSVSPEKLTGDDARAEHQVRAGAAFSALVNTLVIALVALLPGASLGQAGIIVAAPVWRRPSAWLLCCT